MAHIFFDQPFILVYLDYQVEDYTDEHEPLGNREYRASQAVQRIQLQRIYRFLYRFANEYDSNQYSVSFAVSGSSVICSDVACSAIASQNQPQMCSIRVMADPTVTA